MSGTIYEIPEDAADANELRMVLAAEAEDISLQISIYRDNPDDFPADWFPRARAALSHKRKQIAALRNQAFLQRKELETRGREEKAARKENAMVLHYKAEAEGKARKIVKYQEHAVLMEKRAKAAVQWVKENNPDKLDEFYSHMDGAEK